MRVGEYEGRELCQVPGTDTYYYRVALGDSGFGTTHDRHVRVTLGRFDNDIDAMEALADRVDREESDI